MTDAYRPLIQTQADLEEAWRHLLRPLGFHRRSLWLLLIDGAGHPATVMTEITDLPAAPDAERTDGLGHLLSHLLLDVEPGARCALLLSRPGSHRTDSSDRAWASELYAMLQDRALPHEAIHLATDREILPIPLDDAGAVRAS